MEQYLYTVDGKKWNEGGYNSTGYSAARLFITFESAMNFFKKHNKMLDKSYYSPFIYLSRWKYDEDSKSYKYDSSYDDDPDSRTYKEFIIRSFADQSSFSNNLEEED